MSLRSRFVVAALSVLTLAAAAQAAIPVFATYTHPQFFRDDAKHSLTLKNTGERAIAFNASGATQKSLISFSAECQVIGDVTTWADLNVLVDGVAIAPSNSDNALCSGGGAGVDGRWSSHAVNVVATGLAQGPHTLTVTVRINGFDAGESLLIDDITIVIIR